MYSTQNDVEFYGRFNSSSISPYGYNYESAIAKAIESADAIIDEYCYPPRDDGAYFYGFFEPGGIEIALEYLNGCDIYYSEGFSTLNFNTGQDHLKFRYRPVLSVTSLAEETSTGTWTARTENTDYIVVQDGVRFILNTPSWKHHNVRATYKAGWKTTPRIISEISGKLAAAILQQIIDSGTRTDTTAGPAMYKSAGGRLLDSVLSVEDRERLNRYKILNYAVC